MAPFRGILGDGGGTFGNVPAQHCLPSLPSNAEECARAAGNRGIFASGRRPWRRGRSAVQPDGHYSSDWRYTVALQDLVRFVAHRRPSSVRDCVRSVHARDRSWRNANRHSSVRVCTPRGLAIYRHDISIPDELNSRTPYAQPLGDLAWSDIGIRSIFRKIGGVHLVLNDILKFDVKSRCRGLPRGRSATYGGEQNRKNRGFSNHTQDWCRLDAKASAGEL